MVLTRAGQGAAQGIEHAERGILADGGGNVFRPETRRPLREDPRRRRHLVASTGQRYRRPPLRRDLASLVLRDQIYVHQRLPPVPAPARDDAPDPPGIPVWVVPA